MPVTYEVSYGYNEKFELTEQQAEVLMRAREKGLGAVRLDFGMLSTNFRSCAVQDFEWTSQDLRLAEDTAEWLSRDGSDVDMDYEGALTYSKKLVRRVGYSEAKKLLNQWGNGAYPSQRKFLTEAKQTEDEE